jgi:predicted DNA binding protein
MPQLLTEDTRTAGIYHRLVSVKRLRHGPATLTRKQTALLKTAVETRYFETPKTATTKALAEKLRTSPLAISETMRRALKKIVTHYLEGTP